MTAGAADDHTHDDLARFEAERKRLVGLAYRLLGSVSDAEDVVQEAWLRWQRADRASIDEPAAWLTTVTSRIGLDRLRARQRDRADYVGPWLPEPILTAPEDADPARHAELSDSLTTAFLLLLEQLTPTERLVVLLADVFDQPFEEIARILGKSPPACRQLASRARRKLKETEPSAASRPDPDTLAVAGAFISAALRGDQQTVLRLLSPDVVLVSDGGPDRHAARRPVVGADRVGRFVSNVVKRLPPGIKAEPGLINGTPGFIVRAGGAPYLTQAFDVVDGRITRISVVMNPSKLTALAHPVELA
jgi:RNA polymerase sigma-70 factor (ECF subfamily)